MYCRGHGCSGNIQVMSFTNTKQFFLQYDKSHLFCAFQKSHYKNIKNKKQQQPVGPELLVKSLLLKCKRQRRGERRRREAGGGRVMRGILARGMTSQQVPGALGKCDFIPSNAQIAPQAEKGKAV